MINPIQARFNQILTDSRKTTSMWGKAPKPEASNLTSDIVNLILSEAISLRASDIHVEPRQNGTHVRYRIDGKLHDVLEVAEDTNIHIMPRLKILADLPTDPGSSKKSWDGRFTMEINRLSYDFRISTFPTVLGDKMAIRILNKNSEVINLKNIGLSPNSYLTLENIFQRKRGLIVVSGPTGAGKTTTLYSILHRLHTPDVNIITLENPVEYQIDGINQCDVNKKNSESFSTALRVALRQDPDIILIGEIRDLESADIAIRASITGHLVMTSLHANSALGSVARLINMGLERHMVSYALTGAVSQHLIPRICDGCRTPYKIDMDVFNKICTRCNLDPITFFNKVNKTPGESIHYLTDEESTTASNLTLYKGMGCPKCNGTGYKGRIGIFEVVQFNEDLREAIIKNVSISELENIAAKSGFVSLASDALQKVIDGIAHFDDIYPILLDRS
jgi:type IV pilus assembly protein PilB